MMYLEDLIKGLRGELEEYGEMLARYEEAEARVAQGTVAEDLAKGAALLEQEERVGLAVRGREQVQRQLAQRLGLPEEAGLGEIIPSLPRKHQLLVKALADENEGLRGRVQQRASLKRRLLQRSLQMIENCLVAA
jgi:hypothetical protein